MYKNEVHQYLPELLNRLNNDRLQYVKFVHLDDEDMKKYIIEKVIKKG